jgi:hypothetical protein
MWLRDESESNIKHLGYSFDFFSRLTIMWLRDESELNISQAYGILPSFCLLVLMGNAHSMNEVITLISEHLEYSSNIRLLESRCHFVHLF